MDKSVKSPLLPPKNGVNLLIFTLSVTAIPHFFYQPIWVAVLFSMMMCWRILHQWRQWPLPSANLWLRVFHNGAAALTIIIMFGQFGLTIGRDAGVALLTIMLAFKTAEMRSLRDYYLTVFLGYFLIITNFFYSQSVLMMVLMLAVIILLTSCLLTANTQQSQHSLKQQLLFSSKMVLQSIPLMLLCFFFFPRISGPIWGQSQQAQIANTMTEQLTLGELPSDRSQSTIGMSDKIQLGKISNLIQSDEIAFRVKFKNNLIPSRSALYWRGPSLWHSDGTVWSPLKQNKLIDQVPEVISTGESYQYTITLEPHQKTWLFALDVPTRLPTSLPSKLNSDGDLNSQTKINQRTQYNLVSQTDFKLNPYREDNLAAALKLPEGKHQRTRSLAKDWQQQSDSPQDYINKVLNHFHSQGFVYTLRPPLLRGDTVDSFLFETKQGFCEHYAATFTILMRAAGIPARIVTGYQGGELNPVDNIFTVHQRDAHAWTEVWLPDQGWLRIDPTHAVAEYRIENGISELLSAHQPLPSFLAENTLLGNGWRHLQNNWSAFNNAWDLWIVTYGPKKQTSFLSMFGVSDASWKTMTIIFASLLFFLGSFIYLRHLYRRSKVDKSIRLYRKFCRKLRAVGIEKAHYEGPQAFGRRAQKLLPHQQHQIEQIISLYSEYRYRNEDATLLDSLSIQIKHFRPVR